MAETRERIVREAAARFAAQGVHEVRLDQVADAADVARGTLYKHFPTKESLVTEIMVPVLERAVAESRSLPTLPPKKGVEGLLDVYLLLWRTYPDALRVAYQLQAEPLGDLEKLHTAFLKHVLQVLEGARRRGMLRAKDAALAGRMLARVAVPLLELLATRPDGDALFRESVRGLLLT